MTRSILMTLISQQLKIPGLVQWWVIPEISVWSPKLQEGEKAKERQWMEETYFLLNSQLSGDIPLLHPLLSIQKSIRLLYKVSTCLLSPQVIHLKLAPLEKQYYFVQRLPMHIICLNRVDLLSQCHPLMSAMKQQLSFPLHSEPLLSLDRVHPTHL